MRAFGLVILALTLGFVGCSQAAPPSRAEVARHALSMVPADPRLSGLYTQSCKACHTALDSGAPLTGDREAWGPRWGKGLPALLQSTVNGMGGMPAGGQCFACGSADLEALIRFMADRQS